jgi:hypothetical protein
MNISQTNFVDLSSFGLESLVTMRRVGGKILIPASAVRRFAREDHPESVRAEGVRPSIRARTKRPASGESLNGCGPRSETSDDRSPIGANGRN